MPVPTISDLTGIFLVAVGEPVAYTPFATEAPTSWACSGLPSGVTINTTSGLVSGSPTTAGVSTCALVATNGTGASAPLVFVFNAVASPLTDEALVDLYVDLQTGDVSNPRVKDGPQGFGKDGDVIGFNIGFVRSDTLRRVDVTNVKVTLRDNYDSVAVALYDAAPRAPVDLSAPLYSVLFSLTAAEILQTLVEHSDDGDAGKGTNYELAAKIDMEFTFDLAAPIDGVSEMKRTTKSFAFHLAQSLG